MPLDKPARSIFFWQLAISLNNSVSGRERVFEEQMAVGPEIHPSSFVPEGGSMNAPNQQKKFHVFLEMVVPQASWLEEIRACTLTFFRHCL